MTAAGRSARVVALLAIAACCVGTPAAAAPPAWSVVKLAVYGAGPFSYAEPGIAFGPGGLALVNAASANTGAPPTFWLSRDDGASWTPGGDFDPTGASTGDADAAIGADGYLYALNLGYNPPPNPTILVSRSRDARAWSGPAEFPAPHGNDQPDRPWLVVDPHDPAHVDVVNSEGGGNLVIWRSVDHAASFTGPDPVTGGANSQAGLALSSRPLFDPTARGRLFVLYETAASETATALGGAPPYEFPLTQLWLATSNDFGSTWSNRLVLDAGGATVGHLLVASAIDATGNLYAAFSRRETGATQTAIYLMHSTDYGASWSAPVGVSAPTKSNVMPALAVGPRGGAHLSWYGSSDPDYRSDAARWVEMYAETPDALAAHPTFSVSQVSGAKPVHVGGIDTAGNVGANLGANWGLRDFQSIAVDACGSPHLTWEDDNGAPITETAYRPGCGRRAAHRHRHRRHHRPRRRVGS